MVCSYRGAAQLAIAYRKAAGAGMRRGSLTSPNAVGMHTRGGGRPCIQQPNAAAPEEHPLRGGQPVKVVGRGERGVTHG